MKKLGAFLAGVGLLASATFAADSNTATSVNVVGFSAQDLPPSGKLVLVGVPFKTVGGGSTTLMDLFGTNQLRNAAFYTSADRVLLWDNVAGTYRYFAIRSSDMQFHNAQSSTTWGQAATNPVVTAGMGLWIWAPSSASATNRINVSGEVISETNKSVNIYQGLNLLSHLFSCDLDVNNSDLTNSQAVAAAFYTSADRLYVWDSVAQTYHIWGFRLSDRKWHYADNSTQWGQGPVTNKIPAGEGFWYRRLTNSVMTWTENNPYSENLK